jgi:hypothetical protein
VSEQGGEPVDPTGAAMGSILSGQSASAGLRSFRLAGGRIASQTWFHLTGELQAMLARREGVYDEPVNRRPTADQIETWDKWKGKGYIQQVEVLVRDRDTQQIISIPFSHLTRILKSRKSVIQDALATITPEGTDGDKQQILGAVYAGTYQGAQTEA